RFFTQTGQHLVPFPSTSRPRLPYLSQPTLRPTTSLLGPNPQLARLLSTETRRYIREQVWLATKWSAYLWTTVILLSISYFGFKLEWDERERPTPDEWRFYTRQALRAAREALSAVEEGRSIMVDWAFAGNQFRACLERLEDRAKEGKGIREVEEGGLLVEGVGKTGLDVSGKSWPWRAGYYEVLMGCAMVAEHLDDMVLDKTRRVVFPKEYMIGPSNPDPRPVSARMKAAPREEDCERPFDPPETYYMRILTTTGFTTKQKLDAALAYANWLEFKGLSESAEEMYRWGVDIAKAALPSATPADALLDPQTTVFKADSANAATQNLLHATTALAIHRARTGNVSSALPMLLSVLRAYRSAPISPFSQSELAAASAPKRAQTDIGAFFQFFGNIFTPPKFPPPPPSGDLPFMRDTDKPTCEESELMLYIGEILFATSPQAAEGVGWTKQAVEIAEANLRPGASMPVPAGGDAEKEREKCRSCLMTGVGNWETMLRRLAEQQ
ncbi:hypothetical protein BAUCODRAFT_41512, partial [Baudoinia panamericana UAMH 10762]